MQWGKKYKKTYTVLEVETKFFPVDEDVLLLVVVLAEVAVDNDEVEVEVSAVVAVVADEPEPERVDRAEDPVDAIEVEDTVDEVSLEAEEAVLETSFVLEEVPTLEVDAEEDTKVEEETKEDDEEDVVVPFPPLEDDKILATELPELD